MHKLHLAKDISKITSIRKYLIKLHIFQIYQIILEYFGFLKWIGFTILSGSLLGVKFDLLKMLYLTPGIWWKAPSFIDKTNLSHSDRYPGDSLGEGS